MDFYKIIFLWIFYGYIIIKIIFQSVSNISVFVCLQVLSTWTQWNPCVKLTVQVIHHMVTISLYLQKPTSCTPIPLFLAIIPGEIHRKDHGKIYIS